MNQVDYGYNSLHCVSILLTKVLNTQLDGLLHFCEVRCASLIDLDTIVSYYIHAKVSRGRGVGGGENKVWRIDWVNGRVGLIGTTTSGQLIDCNRR